MFKRGKGPLVSVLIPTRGRTVGLCSSISSIYDLAKDKSLVEFVLKIDDDDLDTIATVARLEAAIPIKKIISPRGRGYHDMHLWVNDMSKLASGDWLFLFNDDAKMATPDWDQILLNLECPPGWHGCEDVCCIALPTVDNFSAEEFMFIRRKVVDILGHYSPIPHNDTWHKTLMRMVNSFFFCTMIQVDHEVKKVQDLIREEGRGARETREYTVDAKTSIKIQKFKDAIALQTYIDENNSVNHEITDADVESFFKMFNELPGSKILEVGAHDEPIANILTEKGFKVTGIDLREYCPVQDTPENKKKEFPPCNYEFIRGDFCNLPGFYAKAIQEGGFDSVICISAVEHFGLGTYQEGSAHRYYDVIAMRLIWTLLKDGGSAYISVPYGSTFVENIPHWRVYDNATVIERLIQDFNVEGFQVIVADDAVINGQLRHRGDAITLEEANAYSGTPPHVSVILKLRKAPVRRLAPDGR